MSTTSLIAALTELDRSNRGLNRQEVAAASKHSIDVKGHIPLSSSKIEALDAFERFEMWNEARDLLAIGQIIRRLSPTSSWSPR